MYCTMHLPSLLFRLRYKLPKATISVSLPLPHYSILQNPSRCKPVQTMYTCEAICYVKLPACYSELNPAGRPCALLAYRRRHMSHLVRYKHTRHPERARVHISRLPGSADGGKGEDRSAVWLSRSARSLDRGTATKKKAMAMQVV